MPPNRSERVLGFLLAESGVAAAWAALMGRRVRRTRGASVRRILTGRTSRLGARGRAGMERQWTGRGSLAPPVAGLKRPALGALPAADGPSGPAPATRSGPG